MKKCKKCKKKDYVKKIYIPLPLICILLAQ